jgi:hypothetical protein
VTSSPLYQPMDTMERLGYEVRVYLRVPDLGLSRENRSLPSIDVESKVMEWIENDIEILAATAMDVDAAGVELV